MYVADYLQPLLHDFWCHLQIELMTRVGQYFNKLPISPDQVLAIQLLHAFSLGSIYHI